MATLVRVGLGISLALALIGCSGGSATQKPDGGPGGSSPGGRGGQSGHGGASGGSAAGQSGADASAGTGGGGRTAGAGGTSPAGAGGGGGSGAVVGTGGGGGGRAGANGGGTTGTGGLGGSGGGALAGAGGPAAGGSGGNVCETSVSGIIRDPAGIMPVYRAHVYAPSAPLAAVPEGTACGTPTSGQPIADTITDTQGRFKLVGVPAGSNIPLVIQLGKWRRQITVPSVLPCTEIALTDSNLTRLPRNSSEGHLPRIALTTGSASAIECWLRKVGISDSEFTPETGAGRVHLFFGGAGDSSGSGAQQLTSGESFTDAYTSLFANPTKLASYDMVLLGCEGEQLSAAKDPYTANIKGYADGGGRILAEHFQSYWVRRGPTPWPATANWLNAVSADIPSPLTAVLDASSADGMALEAWVTGWGVAANGQLSVYGAQHSLTSVIAPTQQWLVVPPMAGPLGTTDAAPLLMSFATPVEATSGPQCGRVDFTDIHSDAPTGGAGSSDPAVPFPQGCQGGILSAQELLVEFLFFDTPTCTQVAP